MEVKLNEKEYQIVKNYRDGYDEETVKDKVTEYFSDFDKYIKNNCAYNCKYFLLEKKQG